jgi:hypothetical protein
MMLNAVPTATDPQGLPITFTYQWQQSGAPIPGATSQSLDLTTLSSINKGDTFSVIVTPSDNLLTGNPFTSSPVTIAGLNPITLS